MRYDLDNLWVWLGGWGWWRCGRRSGGKEERLNGGHSEKEKRHVGGWIAERLGGGSGDGVGGRVGGEWVDDIMKGTGEGER